MNNIAITIFALAAAVAAQGQTMGNSSYPQLDGGLLEFNLGKKGNEGANKIRFGGFLDATGYHKEIKNADSENGFDITHASIGVQGSFLDGKLGFFLQTDFAYSNPLMDAWVSYSPVRGLRLTAGQRQSVTDTRQMMMLDQGQAFDQRSYVSRTFFATGRELGIFAEYRLPVSRVGFDITGSVTSGDGRNSFGSTSTDADCGGLKYGVRLSLYPLGFFKPGNELVFNDFAYEENLRLGIGGAFSYNCGASSWVGEGHNDFQLYNRQGDARYPDYRRFAADILLKWRGFSLLADYINTSATRVKGIYTDPNGGNPIQPCQIADYLALGNGFDVQAGYLFPHKWAVDAAYSLVRPEFDDESSYLKRADNYELGVSKYFLGNSIKLQVAGEYTRFEKKLGDEYQNFAVKLNMQLVF